MFDTDYYELLQVERGADEKAIKSAYRRLAMECHPDRNPGCKDSESRFKAISVAYDCLKDPQKRAAYDRFGHAAFQNGGAGAAQDFGSFSDIFETIFGEFMQNGQAGGGRRNVMRGSDLRYDLEVSLEDAYDGKQVELRLDTTVACKPCDGSGAKPGTSARQCAACGGRGQVRASPRPTASCASRSPASSSRRKATWSRSALRSPATTAGRPLGMPDRRSATCAARSPGSSPR